MTEQEQIIERVTNYVLQCDLFKMDKKQQAIQLICNNDFKSGELLSADEKRNLGLNTRAKYSKAIIECFDVEFFGFDPVFFSENILRAERSLVWALNEIERLKKLKIGVKKVKLEGYSEWDNVIVDIDKIPTPTNPDYINQRTLYFAASATKF